MKLRNINKIKEKFLLVYFNYSYSVLSCGLVFKIEVVGLVIIRVFRYPR